MAFAAASVENLEDVMASSLAALTGFDRFPVVNATMPLPNTPDMTLVVYNPTSTTLTMPVCRPCDVALSATVSAVDVATGNEVAAQLVSGLSAAGGPTVELCLLPTVPALGFTTLFVTTTGGSTRDADFIKDSGVESPDGSIVLRNDEIEAHFEGVTGALMLLRSLADGTTATVNHTFAAYYDVGNAYEFNPTTNVAEVADASNVTVRVERGPVVSVVYQYFNSTLAHATRVYNCSGCGFVEAEVVVGPLVINRTFVTRLSSSLSTGSTFYTGLLFPIR